MAHEPFYFWQNTSIRNHGEIINSPMILKQECLNYFQNVEDNPIKEDKISFEDGQPVNKTLHKKQIMTRQGLCVFLNISLVEWNRWRKEITHLAEVIRWAENVIAANQLIGGSSRIFSETLVVRLTGLTDKAEIDHKSNDGTMSPVKKVSQCPTFQKVLDAIEQSDNDEG